MEAFRSAGANPVISARLALLLRRVGAVDVTTLRRAVVFRAGQSHWVGCAGRYGPVAPTIAGVGIASEDDLSLDHLQRRVAQALVASVAVLLAPTAVGA